MKILVCISIVPDTTTRIKLKEDKTSIDESGVQWIINPWDELALTRALELKENSGGKITSVAVMHVGNKTSEAGIRKALAIGADEAYRIDAMPVDSVETARYLANAINPDDYGLILAGIESSDYNSSMVGGMLAEMLDLPSISSVSTIDFTDDQFIFTTEIDGGTQKQSVLGTAVAIAQKGISKEARIPNMRGIMMARKKPLHQIAPDGSAAKTRIKALEMPPPKAACKMFKEDEAKKIIELLHSNEKIL